MTSPGWLSFIFLMFLLNLIIGNVFSGATQPLTPTNAETLGGTAQYTYTEESNTAGSVITFFNIGGTVLSWIGRALTADYDFLYDYDEVTQTRTPNEWYIVRYWFLMINFAVFITIGLMIWGK
jgi:hypothetical protein